MILNIGFRYDTVVDHRFDTLNGRFRAECLNAHWFLSLADAQKKLEDWRKYYNRASEHPSCYVIEEKGLCWPGCDPAGYLGFCRARSVIGGFVLRHGVAQGWH